MKPVGSEDFYQSQLMSIVSNSDIDIFSDLYMPLVGVSAFAIYVALVRDGQANPGPLKRHAALFTRLQLTSGQFRKGIEALEATGLVRTLYKQDGKSAKFIYCMYAPKDPESFFQDPLLLGTLRRYVGEEEVQRIHHKYKVEAVGKDFDDVSGGFSEYFNPDFKDPVYSEKGMTAIPHKSGVIASGFDFSTFEKDFSELGYSAKSLSDDEISKLERYAALYGYDGESMALVVSKCFNASKPMGKKVDFLALEKQCDNALRFDFVSESKGEKSEVSSETALAKKILLMDETAPVRFLCLLQGNKKPASADIRIVNTLMLQMGLPAPCVNALVDYVLQTNNNILTKGLCEKLAAYLVRENVQTSRDAMDKLMANKGKPSEKKEADEPGEKKETPAKKETKTSDEELDAFLKELYGDIK